LTAASTWPPPLVETDGTSSKPFRSVSKSRFWSPATVAAAVKPATPSTVAATAASLERRM
jgi:hypothetical protein